MPGDYAICRWTAGTTLPDWVNEGAFTSVTRSPTELSAVCAAASVPAGTVCEGPWRILAVRGPLDFALTGIMASLYGALAAAGISLFVVSTYDTDYVLVRETALERAKQALETAGHRVDDGPAGGERR